jgi:hypothetical protein
MVGKLQESSRHFTRDLAFHGFTYDGCLLGAPGHQDNFACFKDGTHTHGDGFGGYILLAPKIARSITAGKVIQCHQTRTRVRCRARLVKTDVAGTADP